MQNFSHVYAYMRFSSDPQADGFSFDRQRESAFKWTRERGIPDDCVEPIEDSGFSAYSGAHVTKGALGKLLTRLSTSARVGNELVLFEAVDRASRQGLFTFSQMINQFLEAGVFIHFLGEDEPFSKQSPPRGVLEIKLALLASLAREESFRKSVFSSNNWKNKRARAYQDGTIITKECPRWLRVENREFVVDMVRVASIHAVFDLAKSGWGVGKIVRYANEQKWPVPGKGKVWHNSLLTRLFANRALLGEFQPHVRRGGKKVPEGAPIEDYYPKVMDSELFFSVRASRSSASSFPNRRDEHNYNYLQGVGRCECGGTWRRVNKQSGKQKGYAQYSCSNRQIGTSKCMNLPARHFDHHFIAELCIGIPGFLAKIRASTIDKGTALSGELRDTESRLANLGDSIEANGDPGGMLTKRMSTLISRKTVLLEEIEKFHAESIPSSIDFSKTEALSIYIPAFLTYYEESKSEGAKNAFSSRALFRSRLLSVVERVTIALNRTNLEVLLKNGDILKLTIPPLNDEGDAGYGVAPDDAGDNDFDIEGDRRILDELDRLKPIY